MHRLTAVRYRARHRAKVVLHHSHASYKYTVISVKLVLSLHVHLSLQELPSFLTSWSPIALTQYLDMVM